MLLQINPRLEIQASRISEDQACVVVDDFLLNARELVDYAVTHREEFIEPERAYPGRILPFDNDFLDPLHRFIRYEMTRIFPFCRGGAEFHTQFSLATLQPEQFTWIQRLCHTDPRLQAGRVNYAALLYLFDNPDMGGTGFYRWKDETYWQRMAERQRENPDAGLDELRERFELFREPPRYMTASNEAAELLDVVPARFNRLVFYSGDLPHNAHIEHPELLSPDPARGRLTLNCFVNAVPRN
jgi:hypothetical protein